MTLIFPASNPPEGFESGNFGAWTGTTGQPQVQSAVKHHGSYAMMCNGVESAYKTISAASTCYARVYFRTSGYPSGSEDDRLSIIALKASSTTLGAVRLCRDSGSVKWSLFYRNDSGGHEVLSTQNIPDLDAWCCVELMVKVGGSETGEARFWLDEAELLSETGLTNNDAGTGVTRVECGNYLSQGTVPELFYDCVVAADAYIVPETENNLEVDNLTVNKELKLPTDAASYTAQGLVDLIWKYDSGVWLPVFNTVDLGTFDVGTAYVRLKDDAGDTPTHNHTNISLITVSDRNNDPILIVDQGFVVKKDLSVGGFVSANQGVLALGSGMASQVDRPRIWLLHSDRAILDGIDPLRTNPPDSPSVGDKHFDKDNNHRYQWNGNSWMDLGQLIDRIEDYHLAIDQDASFLRKWNGTSWTNVGSIDNYSGYFDTLYLTKSNGSTPAHLTLATCGSTAH